MDRYFVFAFVPGRAYGGFDDLDSSYPRSDAAIDRAEELNSLGLKTHVLDRKTMSKVEFA